MSDKIEVGDFVKIDGISNVYQVKALTRGERNTPDGWYVVADCHFVNPRFCKKYKGATSVLVGVNR
jgi:hypothetical protein